MSGTICTVFGTRPEVIKLFPVIQKLKTIDTIANVIVSTSQHREMISDLLEFFEIQPHYDLDIIQPNQSLAGISTRTLTGLDAVFKQVKPELLVVQGDTTTAFISGLSAFYSRIPVAHVEAGLRSFDMEHPYPEEANRRLLGLVSNLHFAPTTRSAENLLREGVDANRVFVTGNTVIDTLQYILGRDRVTWQSYLPQAALDGQAMILVTAHRRESWGKALLELCHALMDIVKLFPEVHVVYPVHLNPNVRDTVFPVLGGHSRIHLLDPLPYPAFVAAMSQAKVIISDSGGVQEEAPALGKPVLVYRKVTEREEGIASGNAKLSSTRESLIEDTSQLLGDTEHYKRMSAKRDLYGDGCAGERIVQAILNYLRGEPRPSDFEPTSVRI